MSVYLLHFDEPYKHARHYLGFAKNLDCLRRRLEHHESGNGANLMRVIGEHGIGFECVRVWPDGDRSFERRLKNTGGRARCCPVCCVGRPRIGGSLLSVTGVDLELLLLR